MSTPYDASLDQEPGVTICPDCGEDLEWHICGRKAADPDFESIIRRIVEAHDGMCLDGKEERDELISALAGALSAANL